MKGDETLLDIAESNLKVAELLYQKKTDDEFFLNITGYHLQQSIELALKHYLETNAIEYPKTHNINDLLDLVPESEQKQFEYLDGIADSVTQLESKTRYIKNYRVSERIIKRAMKSAETLIKQIRSIECNYKEKLNKETKIIKEEHRHYLPTKKNQDKERGGR